MAFSIYKFCFDCCFFLSYTKSYFFGLVMFFMVQLYAVGVLSKFLVCDFTVSNIDKTFKGPVGFCLQRSEMFLIYKTPIKVYLLNLRCMQYILSHFEGSLKNKKKDFCQMEKNNPTLRFLKK